jgi:hypothetical protein
MCAGTSEGRACRGSVIRSSPAVTSAQPAGSVSPATRSTACAVAPGSSMTGFGRTEVSRIAVPPIGPPIGRPAAGLSR